MSGYDAWKTALPDEEPCRHERPTHGSADLDADAQMLIAMGDDPGPMECPDCGELVEHRTRRSSSTAPSLDDEPF